MLTRPVYPVPKPAPGTGIDWSHPLTRGLRLALPVNEPLGARALCDAVTGKLATFTSPAAVVERNGEHVIGTTANQWSANYPLSPSLFDRKSITVAEYLEEARTDGSGGFMNIGGGSGNPFYFGKVGTLGNVRLSAIFSNGGNSLSLDVPVSNPNAPHFYGGVLAPTSFVMIDGVVAGSQALSPSNQPFTYPYGSNSVSVNNSAGGGASTGYLSYFYVWDRALSVGELQAVYANPFDLFLTKRRRARRVVYKPAGGTAYTLTPATGAFALTGSAAQVSRALRVAPATGAFVVTGDVAALAFARRLAPATGAFAVSGSAAQVARALRIAPATGSFQVVAAALQLTRALRVTPAPGSFQVAGSAANLARALHLTPATGAFALTGNAATLTYAAAHTLAVQTGAFVLTGNPATLAIARRMAPATGAYVVAAPGVTVARALHLAPAVGAFALTAPAVSLVIAAKVDAFYLASLRAAATATGSVQASPATSGSVQAWAPTSATVQAYPIE